MLKSVKIFRINVFIFVFGPIMNHFKFIRCTVYRKDTCRKCHSPPNFPCIWILVLPATVHRTCNIGFYNVATLKKQSKKRDLYTFKHSETQQILKSEGNCIQTNDNLWVMVYSVATTGIRLFETEIKTSLYKTFQQLHQRRECVTQKYYPRATWPIETLTHIVPWPIGHWQMNIYKISFQSRLAILRFLLSSDRTHITILQ